MQTRILLVDDDDVLLGVLATVLDLEDYDVVTATGGEEALAAVLETAPDVVVCDVSMPGIDGLEVCRRLKAEPSTAAVPVVLLTIRGGHQDHGEGEAAGCDASLTKPFSPLQLLETLRGLQPDAGR